MRGLLGDRFLRWFAGGLKHRPKLPASPDEGRNTEVVINEGPGLESYSPEAGKTDSHKSDKNCEEAAAASADTSPADPEIAGTDAVVVDNVLDKAEFNIWK